MRRRLSLLTERRLNRGCCRAAEVVHWLEPSRPNFGLTPQTQCGMDIDFLVFDPVNHLFANMLLLMAADDTRVQLFPREEDP